MNHYVRMTWPMHQRCCCAVGVFLVRLTRAERDVLAILLINRGRPLTTTEMIERIYPDPDQEPEWAVDVIRVMIWRLRGKLAPLARITFVGRLGYQLVEATERAADEEEGRMAA